MDKKTGPRRPRVGATVDVANEHRLYQTEASQESDLGVGGLGVEQQDQRLVFMSQIRCCRKQHRDDNASEMIRSPERDRNVGDSAASVREC